MKIKNMIMIIRWNDENKEYDNDEMNEWWIWMKIWMIMNDKYDKDEMMKDEYRW